MLNSSGNSFVGILVAIALTSTLFLSLQAGKFQFTRGVASMESKDAFIDLVTTLKLTLLNENSCTQSLTGQTIDRSLVENPITVPDGASLLYAAPLVLPQISMTKLAITSLSDITAPGASAPRFFSVIRVEASGNRENKVFSEDIHVVFDTADSAAVTTITKCHNVSKPASYLSFACRDNDLCDLQATSLGSIQVACPAGTRLISCTSRCDDPNGLKLCSSSPNAGPFPLPSTQCTAKCSDKLDNACEIDHEVFYTCSTV